MSNDDPPKPPLWKQDRAAWVAAVNARFAAFMKEHQEGLTRAVAVIVGNLPPETPRDSVAILVAEAGHPVLQALPQAIPIPESPALDATTRDLLILPVDRDPLLLVMRATYGVTPHWSGATPHGVVRAAAFLMVHGEPAAAPFSVVVQVHAAAPTATMLN